MVDVVQLVEHRIVVPSVVGSSPIIHPLKPQASLPAAFSYCPGSAESAFSAPNVHLASLQLRGKRKNAPKCASRGTGVPRLSAMKRVKGDRDTPGRGLPTAEGLCRLNVPFSLRSIRPPSQLDAPDSPIHPFPTRAAIRSANQPSRLLAFFPPQLSSLPPSPRFTAVHCHSALPHGRALEGVFGARRLDNGPFSARSHRVRTIFAEIKIIFYLCSSQADMQPHVSP